MDSRSILALDINSGPIPSPGINAILYFVIKGKY
jgi:hypothetical protein